MEDKFEEWDQALEENQKRIKEFDEGFSNIKEDLRKRDEIIDMYYHNDGFSYISDIYGK